MNKFNTDEYQKWTEFRAVKSSKINPTEQELIASLHSKYFKHRFFKPCNCSPKQWNNWIKQLNEIYDNGVRQDTQV